MNQQTLPLTQTPKHLWTTTLVSSIIFGIIYYPSLIFEVNDAHIGLIESIKVIMSLAVSLLGLFALIITVITAFQLGRLVNNGDLQPTHDENERVTGFSYHGSEPIEHNTSVRVMLTNMKSGAMITPTLCFFMFCWLYLAAFY